MHTDELSTLQFFLRIWLQEAVEKCDSALRLVDRTDPESDWRRLPFEQHYLLTATVMSVRFAGQLAAHAGHPLKRNLESFIAAMTLAVEVRDMREHSDEYFTGSGRKQSQFFKGSTPDSVCDMSSSIRDDRGFMLGGVIAVETIRHACTGLIELLECASQQAIHAPGAGE